MPGKRERALLAYLALSPKGRQPRRKLAALLWGDATDQTLLDNLRTCVWRLRKLLGDTEHRLLVSDVEDIVLDIAAFDIDVLAFRRLAAQSGRTALEAAAKLCHGEFLDGLELDSEEFESWRRSERSHHLDQAVDLLSRLTELAMESGQSESAIETGGRILRLDPLHEATARHMMRLYADSGRRGAAIQLYRALSEALLKDVNTQPEAETRQVFASIAQANDSELSGPAAACDRTDAAIPSDLSAPARKWRRSLMGLAAACLVALALGFTWWIHREPGTASAGARASGHDIDPGSYEQFLRVLPLIRARQTGVPQAVQILESLVARNPDFAPAWAQLAYAYCLMSTNLPPNSVWPYSAEGLIQTRERAARYWPQAAAAAQRAIQLDPKLPAAYLALGVLEHFRGRLLAADDLFAKALNLDPYNPDILAWRMALLADVGKQGEALAVAQQLTALDPYVPTWKQDAAEVFWENEYYDTAIEMLQSLQNRPSGPTSLAMIYASQGRYAEAADILETSLNVKGEFLRGLALRWHTATRLLRVAPAKAATLPDSPGLGRLSFVYLHVGAPERSLEQYEDDIRSGFVGGYGVSFSYLWHPSYAPVRKTERFKSLMRNAGMVDYWRQRGWPASCRPAGADDFVCR